MKVCHVCSGHTADDARVFHKQCVSLAEAGYEVHLIATDDGRQPYFSRGVVVHPLPLTQSRWERIRQRWEVAKRAADIAADVYHVHEPELLGPMLAHSGGAPVIFDVHESYLDVLQQRAWIPPLLRPFATWMWDKNERRLIQRCAAVVVATEHIAMRYRTLHPRVVVVCNFADLKPEKIENEWAAQRDGSTCVFAGGLKPDRNLNNTIHALGILRRRGVLVRLWLAGTWISANYKEEVMALANHEGVSEQVQDFGMLPHEQAVALQGRASLGLVNYLPIPNSVYCLPVKMLECMALGLPLVYSNFPTFQQIAGASGAGIAVDPTSPDQIADALERLVGDPHLARQMGEAGQRAVREQFNWGVARDKLLALYRNLPAAQSSESPGMQAAIAR